MSAGISFAKNNHRRWSSERPVICWIAHEAGFLLWPSLIRPYTYRKPIITIFEFGSLGLHRWLIRPSARSRPIRLRFLESSFRRLEFSEQCSRIFRPILLHQLMNASFPPRSNPGFSMLQKHWISESWLRIFRFSEVACWQGMALMRVKITVLFKVGCIDQALFK